MINIADHNYIDLRNYLKDKYFNKVFIICGKNSINKTKFDLNLLNLDLNIKYKFYNKLSFYPEYNELISISDEVRIFNPDLIIAVGGGSVLDYAKIVSVLDLSEEDLKNKIKKNNINFKKLYKILAIPTTAGSGAEVTTGAVLYIDKVKYSIDNKLVRPDDFLLMSELINFGNNKLKSSAGFDAIAQSVESLLSKKSNEKSCKFALKALDLLLSNFLNFLEKPNSDNTFKMCLGSNLAGEAINISKTTAPHAVSYPFTSNFGVSHGHAVAINFQKIIKFNYLNTSNNSANFNLNERFKKIFSAFGAKSISDFTNEINRINFNANIETNLNKLGINIKDNVGLILDGISDERLKNNPINIKVKDIKQILLND